MEQLDYDALVQHALRDVVRQSLKIVEKEGFSDNHHFYITFRTDRSDVIIPAYLAAQHPSDITIVLQHQFMNLSVSDVAFSVTLTFNNIPENLTIPFGAITGFMDPSVKFGLEFTPTPVSQVNVAPLHNGTPPAPSKKPDTGTKSCTVVSLDSFRQKHKK